ncbi:hypothetical protein IV203_024056 [Nitzschia inconspicua]|uniref:Uncharacterized protein n=1 Tax=Nitzschia inconspicua TaxID=303405 RepID=A0A9K3PAR0_9STRA|nr:hypothetical protein IV203_024056 [Nitzschia inconspicua]
MNRLVTKRKIEFEREIEHMERDDSVREITNQMPSNQAKKVTLAAKKVSTPAGESTLGIAYTISSKKGIDEMCDLYFYVPNLPLEYFIPNVINQGRAFTISMRFRTSFSNPNASCW